MLKDKETENAARRRIYKENIEKYREKHRKKKQKQRDKRGEAINAKQREWYQANRERELAKIRERRVKADPTRGLKSAVDALKRGDLSIEQLDRLYDQRLALLHEGNVRKRTRSIDSKAGPISSGDVSRMRKDDK